jgi:hypothetical protein
MPPATVPGLTERVANWAAVTVTPHVFVESAELAVNVTAVVLLTPAVETLKVAEIDPAGIATTLGTVRAGFEECRLTEIPPAGAAPSSVTEPPVELLPPTIVLGVTLTLASEAGLTFSAVDAVLPP